MTKKITRNLIIVVPIYNEQKHIPALCESLYQTTTQCGCNCHLIVIDHRSTDKSRQKISNQKRKFESVTVLTENFPKRCGGKPRNTGLKHAIKLAKDYQKRKRIKIPIATLDADVIVADKFGEEIFNNLINGYNIVSFCERYQQDKLLEWINVQQDETKAKKVILGLSWFRYQLLWGLILSGIKETRGPGGYAMYADILENLNHFQPFDKRGNPVTGENNRLGILAERKRLKVYVSPHTSRVHPRRELVSLVRQDQNKAYILNKESAEVFKLARQPDQYSQLNPEKTMAFVKNYLLRGIRMVLIRSVAFDKVSGMGWWFNHDVWKEILRMATKFIKNNRPSQEELAIVGSGIYSQMYDFVVESLGENKLASFSNYLAGLIPSAEYLTDWANNNSEIIAPDNYLIKNLKDKFAEQYRLPYEKTN